MTSSTRISEKMGNARKTLHIIATDFSHGSDVLVRFSDGSTAIYEAEELEKLRPTPKQMLPIDRGTSGQAMGSIAQ